MTSTGSVALVAQGLTIEIEGRPIFSDVSFQVGAGQTCQLVGPNGSGKTTLLMALCGLFEDYTGSIEWRNQSRALSVGEWPDVGLFMSPKLGLSPMLTPEENLSWFAGLMGLDVTQTQILDALAQIGFDRRILRPVSTLSSGQQQRVKLARLFLGFRPVWVLDEPFTALDLAAVAHLEQVLWTHAERGGLVFFTSHHRLTTFEPSVQVTLAPVQTLEVG
jgi:heme exporter protein A